MTRRWLVVMSMMAIAAVVAPPGQALPPAPYHEIEDTVRSLAAAYLGLKPADIDTISSLTAQGMNEKQFNALLVDLQQEFAVVFPDDEIRRARENDPTVPLSVRKLAHLVQQQQQMRHE